MTLAFVAIGTEIGLPNVPVWITASLLTVTVVSALVATWVIFRWDRILSTIRTLAFALVVGFYFFVGIVFFWGTVQLWQTPLRFYGYYLAFTGTFFLIFLIAAGLYSFYMGIVSIKNYR